MITPCKSEVRHQNDLIQKLSMQEFGGIPTIWVSCTSSLTSIVQTPWDEYWIWLGAIRESALHDLILLGDLWHPSGINTWTLKAGDPSVTSETHFRLPPSGRSFSPSKICAAASVPWMFSDGSTPGEYLKIYLYNLFRLYIYIYHKCRKTYMTRRGWTTIEQLKLWVRVSRVNWVNKWGTIFVHIWVLSLYIDGTYLGGFND